MLIGIMGRTLDTVSYGLWESVQPYINDAALFLGDDVANAVALSPGVLALYGAYLSLSVLISSFY
jgi:hypothetical protein